VTDPSAWRRDDLKNDSSWIYSLESAERDEIEKAFSSLVEKKISHAEVKTGDFPLEHFGPTVSSLRDQIENGRGIAVLKGIPIAGKSVEDIELLYAGIAAHIGESIVQDTDGTLIDHVCDRGLSYDDISVRGYTTNAKLTPHCDSGDIVSLLCVRNAKSGGVNKLSSSIAIYNELLDSNPEYLDTLYEGFYYNIRGNGPPGQYVDMTAHRVPVYSFHQGKLSCRFNKKAILTSEQIDGVPPLTQEEKDAVNRVSELSMSDELSFDVLLEPGDLLLLCNHSVFHTRSAFEDWEEPERRRLLLRKWLNIPNARDLTWEFADHYNTGARQGPYVPGEPNQIVTSAAP